MARQSVFNEDIQKFAAALKDAGHPKTNITDTKTIIRIFEQEFAAFTEANIIEMDFRYAPKYAPLNIALMLTLYRDFLNGETPAKYTKSRGVKDGYTRPMTCQRTECIYNSATKCRYNPTEKLKKCIVPGKCKYYATQHENELSYATSLKALKKKKAYDYLYSRRANYADSHSARWSE